MPHFFSWMYYIFDLSSHLIQKNMKNLFNSDIASEVLARVNSLQINSERQWGKMEVGQMVAHCSETMKQATGLQHPSQMFIGKILGPFFKHKFYNDEPFKIGTPATKSAIISDQRDLAKEKIILEALIRTFATGGPSNCTTHPHPFFGRLTPAQWSRGMYKHLDHHLRQFGA
jgi:hypothetical protein